MALRAGVVLGAASLALGFGCGAPPAPIVHDLVALFDEASPISPTEELDVGSPRARPHLIEGWSGDETASDGGSFVWAVGPRSSVELVAGATAPSAVRFRAWPFHFDGAPVQSVGLWVDGLELGEVALAPGPAEYRIPIPDGVLGSGTNRIELRYAYHRAPSDVVAGGGDGRSLAVGWDWIRFDGVGEAGAPRASGTGPSASLVLPEGTGLEYYLDVPPESALVLEGVRALGEEALVVRIDTDTLGERREILVEGEASAWRGLLPPEGGLVRLGITAVSGSAVLRRPSVRGRLVPPPAGGGPEVPPDIIVFVIDTLRADHLGCYGYGEATSPVTDALAEDAVLFENAVAQSSWTRPSVASMMTGLLPRAHLTNGREDALPPGIPTLAERLGELGYETIGLVTNTNVAAPFGFARGFDTYELLLDEDPRLGYARANELVDRALDLLERRESSRPLFLYLHANDPHDPYSFSDRSGEGIGTMSFMKALESGAIAGDADLARELVALYDAEIRFVDAELGRFRDYLRSNDLYEEALFVLLSDHGEEFDDHGWWRHGKTLYHEQLHVPLIVKWPDGIGAGTRVETTVRHIDLLPTLVEAAGAPAGGGELPGRSLRRIASAPDILAPVAAESYLRVDGRELASVYAGARKLVRYYTYDRPKPPHEVFDLRADPSESRNLAEESPGALRFLAGLLRRPVSGPVVQRTPAVISEDTERRLRALGYVR